MRIERFLVVAAGAFVACLLAACDRAPVHPALTEAPLPRLVPAHEFVFNQQGFGGFSFSPDGTRLAWHGPSGWRSALHVRSEATGTVHVYRVGGSAMHWSADSRRLLILDDKSGAENYHLYRLDIDEAEAKLVDLTPFPGVRVRLFQIPESDPEHVLVLHNRRNRTVRDLYRLNLSTGAEEVVALNPGDGVIPLLSADGKFLRWRRAAMPERARGKPLPPELREKSALSRSIPETTRRVGIAPDRTQAWVLSNRGRDRIALFHIDASKREVSLVHEDERADVGGVVMSQRQGKPLLAKSQAAYPRVKVFDPQFAADLEPLLKSYRGEHFGFGVESMDATEQRFVISVYTHANRRYYLIDRSRRQPVLLGESRSTAFSEAMVMPEPVEYSARDGLRIPAFLLRPAGAGTKPLPLVLLVHGGPWSRAAWGDADSSEDMLRAQFLANRGYAVLLMNFRGSTGYGRAFMAAGVGEFGAAMQNDVLDGLRWAVERGIADPKKVAVMGYSYGGYATLMALAQNPTTFACGIDIAGPTDLARLIENFPAVWELELDAWYRYVGDPAVKVDRDRMEQASPVNLADRIERPVLILQGRKDVRVRPAQSIAMVERLRQHGKPVEFAVLEDMGHSTSYWAHNLFILRKAERFLGDCLGGRSARFDRMEWVARLTGRLPWR